MKKILVIMAMLLALTAGARDRLYIEDFTIAPNEPVDVYIYLDNDTTYSSFQTDLYLPAGLEIEMEDDEYIIDPVYSRLPSRTHVVSTSLMPDGAIRILATSQNVKPIQGNSGAVLVMSLIATQDVTNAPIELRNTKAVEMSGQKHNLDDCQAFVNPGPTTIEATSISLNQTTAEVTEGETLQLTATVLPQDATDHTVTWTSSNTAVATVDANGLVTAVSPGTATITATTNDGSNLSATCVVTVNQAIVLASSITLNQATAEVTEGETLQLTATVLPQDATDHTVTWTSSNTAVATVDANGLVTAVSPGTATITATTNDGTNLSASCQVAIKTPALRGDVNLSGKVDVTDVNIVVNIILGKDNAANYDGRADVNSSGGVDVTDVNAIVNIVLGKE